MTTSTRTSERIEVGGNVFTLPSADLPRSDKRARQERQAVYMAWLLQPKDMRDPATKTAMAERLGVTIQTLLSYERDPEFSQLVRERLAQSFRTDRLPHLFDSLYQTATDPENPRQVQAARTLLEWFGRTQEVQGELAELTDEELEKLAEHAG